MATNPNNAVGTNGAFGGRTSVNAFNDVLSIFNGRGIVQGWDMAPNEGMIINIGGDGTTRDVAVAEDNIGNKTTINNISEEPIALTIPAAPAASSRIDAVVAYVDNPAQGSATETDNPAACGLIVVEGTVATTPTAPDEEAIRTAITADGGAGTVAYYVVLGTVTVASGTTDISANMLTKGGYAAVKSDNVDCTYSTEEQRAGTWLDGKPLYRRIFSGTFGTVTQGTESEATITIAGADFALVKSYWVDRRSTSNAVNQGFAADTLYQGYTQFDYTGAILRFRTKQSWMSNMAVYTVVEYTKVTD